MSADSIRRTLNALDSEIASLEKRRADLEQKEADRTKKINDTQRSITKNTSASMLSSKSRQIQGYQNEIARFSKDKADLTSKIASRRRTRAETAIKLQKEEALERDRETREQKTILQSYEKRIAELSRFNVTTGPRHPTQQDASQNDKSVTESFDVFISHAWEDKEDFVNEFVDELVALDIAVWYDKKRMMWGDSMRAKIDEGLSKSKFGIVVISPNYILPGKYWTKAELDSLFQLESVNGKTLLPIWHNITKKEVMEFSPIIAGKLAMTTASMTPKEIAEEMQSLLNSKKEEEL